MTGNLEQLAEHHIESLYEIARRSEPSCNCMVYEQFFNMMKSREGFVLRVDNAVAGCISFSHFTPGLDILIHCTIDERYQRRWCSRPLLKALADYAYGELGVLRVSGYCISGISDKAGEFLRRLGFKHEGTVRNGVKLEDGIFDIKVFGLLKEECTWR